MASVLAGELATFRVKVTLSGNETYEAWRERDHDEGKDRAALARAKFHGDRPLFVPPYRA